MADVAMSVATLAMMFPHAAQKTRRLMASAISMRNGRDGGGDARLRKNLKDRKVLMMRREPKTDRTEVTRSETSMART
jgi:hypothetical protein